MDLKAYLTLMHLSQLAGMVVPGLGLVLPIIMWVTNKEESAEVNEHGKAILNWMITVVIGVVISMILSLIAIGIIGLIVIGIVNMIFIIIAAIKANQGELWHYPMSFKFIK